jgi:hypothetical protein
VPLVMLERVASGLAASRHWSTALGGIAAAVSRAGGLSSLGLPASARLLRAFGLLAYQPHPLFDGTWPRVLPSQGGIFPLTLTFPRWHFFPLTRTFPRRQFSPLTPTFPRWHFSPGLLPSQGGIFPPGLVPSQGGSCQNPCTKLKAEKTRPHLLPPPRSAPTGRSPQLDERIECSVPNQVVGVVVPGEWGLFGWALSGFFCLFGSVSSRPLPQRLSEPSTEAVGALCTEASPCRRQSPCPLGGSSVCV